MPRFFFPFRPSLHTLPTLPCPGARFLIDESTLGRHRCVADDEVENSKKLSRGGSRKGLVKLRITSLIIIVRGLTFSSFRFSLPFARWKKKKEEGRERGAGKRRPSPDIITRALSIYPTEASQLWNVCIIYRERVFGKRSFPVYLVFFFPRIRGERSEELIAGIVNIPFIINYADDSILRREGPRGYIYIHIYSTRISLFFQFITRGQLEPGWLGTKKFN